jgi:hypothetical protein
MAYLVRKRIKGHDYLYIVKSYRVGGRVRVKTLEYLGRDPDPKRLARAIAYWGVRKKSKK